MKKTVLSIFTIAAFAVLLTSCGKDKENPAIEIAEPANHSDHKYGEHIHVMATFTDDKELASYHIHMAGESGGDHAHDFDFHESADISGESHDYSVEIEIPDTLMQAAYYLNFEVTDAEGKVTNQELMLHFDE